MSEVFFLLLVATLEASIGSICAIPKCPSSDINYLIKQPCNEHLYPPLRYCEADSNHPAISPLVEPPTLPHRSGQAVAIKSSAPIPCGPSECGAPAFINSNIQPYPNYRHFCVKHVLVDKVRPVYDECIQTVPVLKKIVHQQPVTTFETVPFLERRISYCADPECGDKCCKPEYTSAPCPGFNFKKDCVLTGSCEQRYAPLHPPIKPKPNNLPPDVCELKPEHPSRDICGPRQPLLPCEVGPRCPYTDPCEPKCPPPPCDPLFARDHCKPRHPPPSCDPLLPKNPYELNDPPHPCDPLPPRYPPGGPCKPSCLPTPCDHLPSRCPYEDLCKPRYPPPPCDPLLPKDPYELNDPPHPCDPLLPRYPPRGPCKPRHPPCPRDVYELKRSALPCDDLPPRYPCEPRCQPPEESCGPKHPPFECDLELTYPPRDACELKYPPFPYESMPKNHPQHPCGPRHPPTLCRRKLRYPPPPPPSPCPDEDEPCPLVHKMRYRKLNRHFPRRKPKHPLPECPPSPEYIEEYDYPKYLINRHPKRCPKIRERIIYIPIKRNGYRSVVKRKVVPMPVKRKIKKNLVETIIRKTYAPCEYC